MNTTFRPTSVLRDKRVVREAFRPGWRGWLQDAPTLTPE
jgi:hypothetical protein